MKKSITYQIVAIIVTVVFITSCKKNGPPICRGDEDSTVATIKVFSTGFNNPRGLKFGPDGNLYVAEAGVGGTNITTKCTQVIPPVGPYTGSDTGSRISRVDWHGVRTTLVDHLPSSMASPNVGGDIEGVSDVAFVGFTMYGLLAGAGCSHGVPNIPNGVFRVNPDRSWTLINNLSEFFMNNPVQNPNPGDFEPDGTPYSMINIGANLFVLEPNHGELDKISPNGSISRVVDISASQGHIVPTCMVRHHGNFYVGNLAPFPIQNKSNIYEITPQGDVKVFVSGFSTVLGVTFDNHGRLYVLENTTGNPFPTPGTGDIVRIDKDGNREIIASGLSLPTAMTFGPDGRLYVSNWGFGPTAIGGGEILQITFNCEEVQGDIDN